MYNFVTHILLLSKVLFFPSMRNISVGICFIAFAASVGFVSVSSCTKVQRQKPVQNDITTHTIKYAKGFSVEQFQDYQVLKVNTAWPGHTDTLAYALVPREKLSKLSFAQNEFDAILPLPLHTLIATSTTHIPALEELNALDQLVGFAETKYISSPKARKKIETGEIAEIGTNEALNTEMTLQLTPDAVIGFGIDGSNKAYALLQRSGIPVIYNGDWTEETPLGKAEWIKFFGALLNKNIEAETIFKQIESAYLEAKELAATSQNKPTVLSGALFKDVWYMPAGDSWAAQFLEDANTQYLWKKSKGIGSLALSIETVLEKAQMVDYWISPSLFTTYSDLQKAHSIYAQFAPFQNKKIFTFAEAKGATGGLQYYELGPQRPDLILKDLIHIFHPELVPEYQPTFFSPLR